MMEQTGLPEGSFDQHVADPTGEIRTWISDGLVPLLKEFYGCGPDRTRIYRNGDVVVCLLRGGFTPVEPTP